MARERGNYPVIIGVGGVVPGKPISNEAFIERSDVEIETTPWDIESRTGIRQRYWLEKGEPLLPCALAAARQAMMHARVEPDQISGVYFAGELPEERHPIAASRVHKELKLPEKCQSLDLNAACAGGINGLEIASNHLRLHPNARTALVIGANAMSHVVNKRDRKTAILFGDGAGAAVVELRDDAHEPMVAYRTEPDRDSLHRSAENKIVMKGGKVKEHAMNIMGGSVLEVLELAGATFTDDVDVIVPHQANGVLINAIADEYKFPKEKCIVTVGQHANTSSASIFLAATKANRDGQLVGQNRTMLTAIGAGFTGGAILMDTDLSR